MEGGGVLETGGEGEDGSEEEMDLEERAVTGKETELTTEGDRGKGVVTIEVKRISSTISLHKSIN